MAISEFSGTLEEKKYISDDVMYLSFKVSNGFIFQAGQYVMLKIVNGADFRWKPYSILNSPSEKGKLNLCATIIPGGFASEVFKRLEPGTEINFRGPLGHFLFSSDGEEHWFICVGTGITPFYSMIMENISQFSQKKFNLLFGEKSQKDLLFYEELTTLEKKHKNFKYIPTLTQESWNGKKGRVQQHLPIDLQNKTFYICGLKEMVLETKELLEKKGVAKENIKVERYT